jgi:hypothetical protein
LNKKMFLIPVRMIIWSGMFLLALGWSTGLVMAQDGLNPGDVTAAVDFYANLAGANKDLVMSGTTVPAGGGSFSFAEILAGVLFGAIGLGGFIYGKKKALWRPMALGIALMAFPFVPMGVAVQFLVGGALTAALFFWRE